MKDEASQGPSAAPRTEEGGAETDAPGLRLRSLQVHRFRDVRPGTKLSFGDGFHLILGKNATGKSTLLELLAAVSNLDFRGPFFAETPFHIEASFEVGRVSLHADVRRTFEPERMESVGVQALGLPLHEEAETIVRVESTDVGLRQWLRVRTGEKPAVFATDPQCEGAIWDDKSVQMDPLRLPVSSALLWGGAVVVDGQARVPQVVIAAALHAVEHPGTAVPFDEALGTLDALLRSKVVGVSEIHLPHLGMHNPWLPPTLHFAAQGEPVVRDLSGDPVLKAATARVGYDDAKAYFGPAASSGSGGWTYSSPSFQFFWHGKAVRRHDQLSFGQKRLFSFAWYLACNPDVVIADELVNGLHSEWIDWCVEVIGDRQCFLTSQNPILVDAVPFASEEDVRRGIILCTSSRDPAGDAAELSWRQLDDRETTLLGGALRESRLDLLSDLLLALDLW